jgi:hypothetical protein
VLSCAYFHNFSVVTVATICCASLLLAGLAIGLRRTQPSPVLDEILMRSKRADDRRFGMVNAVTYGAVFLLFVVLPRFGLDNYIFPAFVALIGLHFFPMPPLYQHTANRVTGAVMILWAIFCAVHFRKDGGRATAYVTLGAGIALYCSSAWAVVTARRLYRGAGS